MAAHLDRRKFLRMGLLGAAGLATTRLASSATVAAETGELLYNGIRLPSSWPPHLAEIPRQPAVPAYLTSPPAVIPIDVGRQFFVDDFLVAQSTLTRTHHRPAYHPKNPVLTGGMVFSDGVWYDPQDKIFKMWYLADGGTAYATSKDGVAWEKPELDVKKGTNLVQTSGRDSSTVWIDLEEKTRKALQDVPLRRSAGAEVMVLVGPLLGRRPPLVGPGADRGVRRPQHGVLQPVPQGVGL